MAGAAWQLFHSFFLISDTIVAPACTYLQIEARECKIHGKIGFVVPLEGESRDGLALHLVGRFISFISGVSHVPSLATRLLGGGVLGVISVVERVANSMRSAMVTVVLRCLLSFSTRGLY
jgi:hypothetical protein